jgi:hypothetical protein
MQSKASSASAARTSLICFRGRPLFFAISSKSLAVESLSFPVTKRTQCTAAPAQAFKSYRCFAKNCGLRCCLVCWHSLMAGSCVANLRFHVGSRFRAFVSPKSFQKSNSLYLGTTNAHTLQAACGSFTDQEANRPTARSNVTVFLCGSGSNLPVVQSSSQRRQP